MALNILTTLVISDNYKQAFSEASDLLELRRLRLRPNLIATL
jgi:hypothetical protein